MNAAAKQDLRRRMKVLRADLARGLPDFAARLAAVAAPHIAVAPGEDVAGYAPKGDEADPRRLMAALGQSGAALCLPVTQGTPRALVFRRWRPGEALVQGAFGIEEPAEQAPIAAPVLFLVPLLAFDRRGGRLGYGAGLYDAALRSARARRPIRAIGIAFAGQEVDEVPGEGHDEPLDGVATEAGLLMFANKERV